MGQFATNMLFAHMPIIRDIVYGAVAQGADLEALCKEINLNPNDLTSSENKANFEQAYRAWEVAVKATSDPLLGLHLGKKTGPSILGLLGHLIQNSSNLKEVFTQVVSYNSFFTNVFSYRMAQRGEVVALIYEPMPLWVSTSPESARQAAEQAMAGTLNVFEMLSGKRILPKKANFCFKRGGPVSEYERVFNCPLHFNTESNELIFDEQHLGTAVISYDQSLFKVFEDMLRTKQKQSRVEKTTVGQIKELVFLEFQGQVPPVEILASRLNLTVRSLQRRLEEEDISFRSLASQLRKEVALQLLSDNATKVSEVARLLGYADASSFRRAFKGWTNTTPSQAKA
jgi:AraC-like DNA-binding protein